jgi:MFS family permease
LWGLSQPIAGAFADKFGTSKVIIVGSIFYSLGLYITATADSFVGLHLGAGILIGMGISGTGLGVVLPAMARMVAPEKRALALGVGTAAGSAGQFLFIPVAREFLVAYGWQIALILMAIGALSFITGFSLLVFLSVVFSLLLLPFICPLTLQTRGLIAQWLQ